MEIEKLKQLYREMAELTKPECDHTCLCPHSCCAPEYCEDAKKYAKEEFGITLKEEPPTKKGLLFIGEHGCTVEPYLRPNCTVHTCDINSFGVKRGDPVWTEKYFQLRGRIEELEWGHMSKGSKVW